MVQSVQGQFRGNVLPNGNTLVFDGHRYHEVPAPPPRPQAATRSGGTRLTQPMPAVRPTVKPQPSAPFVYHDVTLNAPANGKKTSPYLFTLANGYVARVNAPDPLSAQQEAQRFWDQHPDPLGAKQYSAAVAEVKARHSWQNDGTQLLSSFIDGAGAGLANEGDANLARGMAYADNHWGKYKGKTPPFTEEQIYRAEKRWDDDSSQRFSRDHPGLDIAAHVVGGIGAGVATDGLLGGAGMSSLAMQMARGAAVNGAAGGLAGWAHAPIGDRMTGAVNGVEVGGTIGAVAPVAMRGVGAAVNTAGRLAAPHVNKVLGGIVQRLATARQAGMMLTPGAAAGLRGAENRLADNNGWSVPVRSAQRFVLGQVRRRLYQEALQGVDPGVQLPETGDAGAHAAAAWKAANEALTPENGVQWHPDFGRSDFSEDPGYTRLYDAEQSHANDILTRHVAPFMDEDGFMTPETFIQARNGLKTASDGVRDGRKWLSDFLDGRVADMDKAAEAQNPGYAAKSLASRQARAGIHVLNDAEAKAGDAEKLFHLGHLEDAVKDAGDVADFDAGTSPVVKYANQVKAIAPNVLTHLPIPDNSTPAWFDAAKIGMGVADGGHLGPAVDAFGMLLKSQAPKWYSPEGLGRFNDFLDRHADQMAAGWTPPQIDLSRLALPLAGAADGVYRFPAAMQPQPLTQGLPPQTMSPPAGTANPFAAPIDTTPYQDLLTRPDLVDTGGGKRPPMRKKAGA